MAVPWVSPVQFWTPTVWALKLASAMVIGEAIPGKALCFKFVSFIWNRGFGRQKEATAGWLRGVTCGGLG
jgi:hypothetical protein